MTELREYPKCYLHSTYTHLSHYTLTYPISNQKFEMKLPFTLLAFAASACAMAAPRITSAPVLVPRQEHEDHDHGQDDSGSIPPPPAESTGCELHNDHYHCEGPASGFAASAVSASVPPPPAESTGCELHGDHYHCEGPVSATVEGAIASSSFSIPPPPAESTGCQLHGDHYHCEGPATSVASTSAPSMSASNTAPTSAATSIASSAR